MKALPLLGAVLVLLGTAAPAHADPDNDAFLAALTHAGITYRDPDNAIKAGQKVCDLANSGTSQLDIVRDVRDLNPSSTMASAAKFAQAAASVYCPDRLSDASGESTPTAGAAAYLAPGPR